MDKKIFGIKISTILVAVACLCVSVLIWMFVKYDAPDTASAFSWLTRLILRGE